MDECHRTQSGKLHRAMKAILPGATLIGFTGTPLLRADKQRSIEIFGPYIHTYKYDEAVDDKVVLDLRYEARDIDQNITSEAKIDQWFDHKTKGLSDLARAQLRQKWGTIRKVTSSLDRIREDRGRHPDGHGDEVTVCGAAAATPCSYRTASTRPAASSRRSVGCRAEGQVRHRHLLQSSCRGTSREKRRVKASPRSCSSMTSTGQMLADHFGDPEDRAMHKAPSSSSRWSNGASWTSPAR